MAQLSGSPPDLVLMRSFSPLDGMRAENLQALAKKTSRRDAPMGRVLFREGDEEKRTYYLINPRVLEMRREGTDKTAKSPTRQASSSLVSGVPGASPNSAPADAEAGWEVVP